jgi:hypothetical protein
MVAEAKEAGVEYEHLKRMLDHSREVTFHLAAKYFNEKNGGAQVIHRNGPSSYGTGPNGTLLAPCVDHLDTNEFRRQVKDCLGTGAVGRNSFRELVSGVWGAFSQNISAAVSSSSWSLSPLLPLSCALSFQFFFSLSTPMLTGTP